MPNAAAKEKKDWIIQLQSILFPSLIMRGLQISDPDWHGLTSSRDERQLCSQLCAVFQRAHPYPGNKLWVFCGCVLTLSISEFPRGGHKSFSAVPWMLVVGYLHTRWWFITNGPNSATPPPTVYEQAFPKLNSL